jgi:carboxyl-terminal processing protease
LEHKRLNTVVTVLVLLFLAPVLKAQTDTLKSACALIYSGQFDAAEELVKQAEPCEKLARLSTIINQYKDIRFRRKSAWRKEYNREVEKLEKFRTGADPNDINDVNGLTAALLVVTRAREFADETQRQQLLANAFVQKLLQKALDRASRFETEGKWLDAFTTCYQWLKKLEPDNKAHSNHAEELLDKVRLLESFKDSPCETRSQRYERIEPEMFFRAVDVLSFSYVRPLDHRQMAVKAIERCIMLAEVLKNSDIELTRQSYPINDSQMQAWKTGFRLILDEVNRSPTGLSKDKFKSILERVLVLNASCVKPLFAKVEQDFFENIKGQINVNATSDRDTLLPRGMLIAQFAEAAFSVLDPYTVMVWPRHVEDFEKIMTNEFTGIGIEISKNEGLLTVVSLLPDTPAYYSGLDAGDTIEAIDGLETKDMPVICAVKHITGPAGTRVTLTIRRADQEQTRQITITRAKIIVPTIRGWQRTEAGQWLYMVDPVEKIGYVRITGFAERTADELEKVLKQLESEGIAQGGLILDLRFNSGGLLSSAANITDKFLRSGLIVRTQPRFGVPSYLTAHKRKTHPDYPLVVLINSISASASEIVAGALADKVHNRATLVGERTHGKGSVQGITSYPNQGAQLKYTMAYYHLPSGQKVENAEAMKKLGRNDWGVGPDVEIELKRNELRQLFDVQKANDVLVKADHDEGVMPLKKRTIEQTIEADPQLAVGILIIKAKNIERRLNE